MDLNTKRKFEQAKEKMKSYTDLFGRNLLEYDLIDNAETLIDLENIIENHADHIESSANDAQGSLQRFKKSLGIF